MQILDSDIMDWNNRIHSNKIWVSPQYSNLGPEINIVFKTQATYGAIMSKEMTNVGDHPIDYRFIFSVAKERESEFDDIFDILKEKPLRNKVQTKNGTFEKINVDIKPNITKTIHTVYNTEYTRFEYEFNDKLYSSVIAYVFLLETAIEFFSMIWGYDEDGNEHNLLKYPVGSIVSKPGDKSKDYLVLDLDYSKNASTPEIRYNICEMLYTKKSSVINYGGVSTERESNLCWSRTGRIDDILG